ncbi:hypothetical protein [Alkalibacterium sp. 20]|uniref:hypothetical protein n=1 Tax=Alkalibacterium sp. 20 TaxID=1798803 RepID=UPI0009004422|nr:hypothetical protein [Alkalibacterium sp. 20]OJF90459.1 hypothetical protein AX762_11715 [Alkalibacterium sp. 20]
MLKGKKGKLFTEFAVVIALGTSLISLSPVIAEAASTSKVEVKEVSTNNAGINTYNKLKSLVDNNVNIINNQIELSNEDSIRNFISNNIIELQLLGAEYRSSQEIYTDITSSIKHMNNLVKSDNYSLRSDGSIVEVPNLSVTAARSYNINASYWWGVKYTSFNRNGTIDLKTLFLNTALLQAATAGALGLTPAAALGIIPLLAGSYDGMIANSIQGELDKNTANNGINVDVNSYVPYYSVYPR